MFQLKENGINSYILNHESIIQNNDNPIELNNTNNFFYSI